MKYLSLFSGIGAFESAMKNLNIPFDLVGFSEIDKYAVKSYCAIQNVSNSLNLGDITKIDETKLPKVDFITYGFPCQDISLAGKQQGLFNEDGSKTRSGLFFDALRIIEHTQPMVAIAENVKNLTGKKFAEQFKIVLESLESAGYNNYWKVLNAKDYGIPQNRERVFIISIRKDVDTGIFEFPEPYPLKLRLKDMLEDVVDEKFYLSDVQIEKLCLKSADALIYDKSMIGFESNAREYNDIMPTITSREWKEPRIVNESRLNEINATDTDKVMQIGNCRPTKNRANPNQGRIYDIDGISPCINTKGGGNLEPHIIDKPKVIGGIGEKKSNGGQQWYQQDRVYDGDDVAVSVTTGFNPYYAVAEPAIQRVDIPQVVKVRKYPVDVEKLVQVLREQKTKCGWTNKALAEELELPLTTVEHWFRTDEHFAIPESDVWEDLKWLLEMDDINEFDESIMTFEEKEGVFEKANRCYFTNGISPTLTSTSADEKIIEPKINVVGNYSPSNHDTSRIVDANGLAPTVKENHGTVTATIQGLRIRKLTPKECFRLMGFDDKSFHKAEAVCSNTQLYKQAGNSIVVDVAEELLCMLFDENGNFFI